MGALALYLDLINLFIILMQLLGERPRVGPAPSLLRLAMTWQLVRATVEACPVMRA